MKKLIYILLLLMSPTLFAEDVPLIPRKILLGNPEKDRPLISPEGSRIAYLAPSKDGVMNIWVMTIGKQDDRMVTQDTRNGIFYFHWGFSDQHILFLQDNNGDENEHLKAVDLQTGE